MWRALSVLVLLTMFIGIGWGCSSTGKVAVDEAQTVDQGPALVDSDLIPVQGSYFLGAEDAPITIVTFSSMQCGFCGRLGGTLHQIVDANPDVKVVFKHFPLPSQDQAGLASQAILAAGEQGMFWEMHDGIFENLRELGSNAPVLFERLARELGLDVQRFVQDMAREDFIARIVADLELGRELGVRGTPASFVNGEFLPGAQPLANFEEVIARQRKIIEFLKDEGVEERALYHHAVAANIAAEMHLPEPPREQAEPPAPAAVVHIPVLSDDPMRGNLDAPLITLVEFASYPCPFCARLQPTLAEIEKKYPGEVRLVFKQFPLSFQENAELAALASRAAYEQGKFWEVHQWLFENPKLIPMIGAHLDTLGLDRAALEASLNDPAISERVGADILLGQTHGVRGTPVVFVNGVRVVGAQSLEVFAAVIDAQLDEARRLRAEEGLRGEALYGAIVANNLKSYVPPAPVIPRGQEETPVNPAVLEADKSPSRGAMDAPIVIVEFSSLQCPFCARNHETLNRILEEYDGQVRHVFKHFPLPFHAHSEPAGRALLAAGRQDKYWEMYELIYANQRRLGAEGIFDELAQRLGLNEKKFKKDMNDPAFAAQIKHEHELGRKLGVQGTPAMYINGVPLIGAQPIEEYRKIIEAALAGE